MSEFDQRKNALEGRVNSLVGEQISGVRYFALPDEGLPAAWNANSEFHSLDFGLELELASGRAVGVIWDWQFVSHDLNVVEGRLEPDHIASHAHAAVWDIGDASSWSAFLGVPIAKADLKWAVMEAPKVSFPHDLVLYFQGGRRIWIICAEYRDGEWLLGAMDHITVVFEAELAKRLGRA